MALWTVLWIVCEVFYPIPQELHTLLATLRVYSWKENYIDLNVFKTFFQVSFNIKEI